MNQFSCVGRLGTEPTLHARDGATPVCRFRLAVPRPARDDDGPLWLTVTAFGRQAQACARYLKAGKQVAVSGRLEPDRWTGKDGTTRESVQVVAHQVEFLFAGPPVREDHDPEEPAVRADRARSSQPQSRASRVA